MFTDEIEMTLECAVKMRKHLLRILENRQESELLKQLQYVNGIIQEASSFQDEGLVLA